LMSNSPIAVEKLGADQLASVVNGVINYKSWWGGVVHVVVERNTMP
jgi:hypothetical protein